MLEFSNKGRGSSSSWHSRLLGKRAAMGGRLMTEERLLFSLTAAERQQHSRSQRLAGREGGREERERERGRSLHTHTHTH